ncbi:MAG: hypothetical protein GY780_10420 [bacterium]|nr:hypothetical protein [bacterium]
MKRLTIMMVLVAILAAGSAMAQYGTDAVVKVSPAPAALEGAAGDTLSFDVNIDISKKWHLYAHGVEDFIGVDLVPEEKFILEGLKAEYPHGHEGVFFGEKVMMIEGKDTIKATAVIPAGLKAGEYKFNLSVTAQACDDKTCRPPADLPVSFKLTVK